jgi:preprotein translocase subunit YajC
MFERAYAMGSSSPGTSPQGGLFGAMMPFLLLIFIFYFLLIRPQQKKQKEHRKMIADLKKGDKVLTNGGMYGTIVGIKDNVVVLRLAENVKVELAKNSISQIT